MISKMTEEDNGQKRFKKGLLTEAGDDNLANFIYCGADDDYGAKCEYFFKKNPTLKELPPHKEVCVCGHDIKKNFYIQHIPTKTNIVVGSCCIKRYLPDECQGKTCSECGAPHQNKLVDMCNECRPTCEFCDDRYASPDCCYSCGKAFGTYHCSKHKKEAVCYHCKNRGIKKCIGCNEANILMPTECKSCKYDYFVCPSHGYRTSCKECYAKRS
jgi:hypothetical protein